MKKGFKFITLLAVLALVCSLIPTSFTLAAGTQQISSRDTAAELEVNTAVTGRINSTYHWYKIKVAKSGTVTLTLEKGMGTDSFTTVGWAIALIDSDGNEIMKDTFVSEADVTTGSYTSQKFGFNKGEEIYVRLTSRSNPLVDYKLTVNNKAVSTFETEDNDSKDKADKIKLSKWYTGNGDESDTLDYFKYTASKAGKYKITFKGLADKETASKLVSWKITIYEGNRKAYSTTLNETDALKGDLTIPAVELKKGTTLYIEIDATQPDISEYYKFKVTKVKK